MYCQLQRNLITFSKRLFSWREVVLTLRTFKKNAIRPVTPLLCRLRWYRQWATWRCWGGWQVNVVGRCWRSLHEEFSVVFYSQAGLKAALAVRDKKHSSHCPVWYTNLNKKQLSGLQRSSNLEEPTENCSREQRAFSCFKWCRWTP